MKGKSPPLEAVPLQMATPRKEEGSSDRLRVGSNSTRGFRVPDDWIVEEKPRVNCPTDPGRVDKYYIEPKTGKKFRSVPAVKRYLMDGNTDMSTSEVSKEAGDHSDMQITPPITPSKSQLALPDGWRIEEKRRSSGAYPGMVDKSYIEPKTGQKFRSMTAVKRYLMDGKTDMFAPQVLKEAGDKSDMQIIPLTTSHSSDFVLPDGWRIEEKRRDGGIHPGKIDKYYIEPGTGKKFCSAMAVKRRLSNGSTTPAALRQGRDKRAASLQQMQITPFTAGKTSKFILPDGWIIEERKRSNAFVIDKYYVEQETGQRFRSLIAVERYLREKEEKEFAKPLNTFKRSNGHHLSRRSGSKRKNVSGKKHSLRVVIKCPKKSEDNTTVPKEVTPDRDPTFPEHCDTPEKSKSREKAENSMDDFARRPSTINWVLAGPGGDMWSPFVGESVVPESIKQNWSETFISFLDDN